MSAIVTRAARLARISAIVEAQPISSQGELRKLLALEGIEVTQATLSRDLDELQARKEPTPDGGKAYRIPSPGVMGEQESAALGTLKRWAREVMVSAKNTSNQVVLRTPPGAAQLLASSLDRAVLDGVLGCIAGDDTVLVITESPKRAEKLVTELIGFAQAQTSTNNE
ncbi:arginine repressor [Trueperella bialowiezensis]|uniref:Arginine repressor n=1 Tax=Trueperella bialowiezensis TaxID=312285 RepID=A0A3S4VBZ6_9ACTO|nr:arginine repressor [Trueperella bialowiezensis]VEI14141.1 Arginine repressor [Trueperella bialowiezensis]